MDNWQKLKLLARQAPQAKAVVELIGWNTAIWNSIEDLWYLLYTCVTHELPREKADAIYRQLPTGNAHRKMILAVGEITFVELPVYIQELRDLISETNSAATLRNEMTHGGYGYSIEDGKLGLYIRSTGVGKKNRSLTGANDVLIDELSKLNTRLENLEARLDEFRMIIAQEFFKQRIMSPEHMAKVPEEVLMGWPRCQRERVAPERFRIGDGPYTSSND
jgi:hypothetical protein